MGDFSYIFGLIQIDRGEKYVGGVHGDGNRGDKIVGRDVRGSVKKVCESNAEVQRRARNPGWGKSGRRVYAGV